MNPVLYDAKNELQEKRPTYYVRFGAIGLSPGLPDEYATGPIKNATKQRKNIMGLPSQISSSVTVIAGKSSLSGLQFTLYDNDGCVTKLIADNPPLKNRPVYVYKGYSDLNEEYFSPLFSGTIENVTSSDPISYLFDCVDFNRTTIENIFTAKCTLLADMDPATLSVSSTSDTDNFSATGYIRIDDEVMHYTSKTATSFTLDQRGCFSTVFPKSVAANHNSNTDVLNFVVLTGNPLDLSLQILTSTGLGTNGVYDVLPASQGLGIDIDKIDVAAFETQRDRFVAVYSMTFYESEETEAKKFLEEQIYRAVNAYPKITAEGKISLKLYTVTLPTADAFVIDDTNTKSPPTFDGNFKAGFYNEIEIRYDYDPIDDTYNTIFLGEQADSQTKYAEKNKVLYELHGLRTDSHSTIFLARIMNNIFSRFSNPAPVFGVVMDYTQNGIAVGDTVYLNSSNVPNYKTGKRGGSSFVNEAIDVAVNCGGGVVNTKLFATEFLSTKKYGAITPAGYPVWTAADENQKKYAFIGLETIPDLACQLSDGTDGFYSTPD